MIRDSSHHVYEIFCTHTHTHAQFASRIRDIVYSSHMRYCVQCAQFYTRYCARYCVQCAQFASRIRDIVYSSHTRYCVQCAQFSSRIRDIVYAHTHTCTLLITYCEISCTRYCVCAWKNDAFASSCRDFSHHGYVSYM